MNRKTIPARDLFRAWRKDPSYVAAYDKLAGEFAWAAALSEKLPRVPRKLVKAKGHNRSGGSL